MSKSESDAELESDECQPQNCPDCGGWKVLCHNDEEMDDAWQVRCDRCGMAGRYSYDWTEAVTRWNALSMSLPHLPPLAA